MHVIWKYELDVGAQVVEMPDGARVLSAQVQGEGLPGGTPATMWALVDPDRVPVPRRFVLIGTGHPVEGGLGLQHIGTVQHMGGGIVLHLFEAGG